MNELFQSLLKDKNLFRRKSESYSEEQKYSSKLDADFQFEISNCESKLVEHSKELNPEGNYKTWGPESYDGHQAWIGLSPEQLQTTYSEFYEICDYINSRFEFPSDFSVIDFGAAYGRLGLVLPFLFSKAYFTGYEIVKARVDDGNKVYQSFGLTHSKLICENVLQESFQMPRAQVYFIYDIGEYQHIQNLISKIETLYDSGHRFLLIARGRGVNSVLYKEHPWMMNIFTGHFKSYSIYSCL